MARQIDFVDGASSETTPTIGNIVASALIQYPDDATYEATEQGAPTEGNIYANTTNNVIRYYDGSAWRTVLLDEVADDVFHIVGSDDDTKRVRFEVDGGTTGVTRVISTVDEDGTMVLEAATQTLTNKTIEVVNNTIITEASGNLISTELNSALGELQQDIDTRELSSNKGIANGYASLDSNGLVPATQLPSYVDDVEEYADLVSFPVTGESGKIYIALDTNLTYRWTGTVYVEIASNQVASVNGQVGAVVLDTDDVSEATNLYHTESRVDNTPTVLANTAKVSFPEAPTDGTPYARQDGAWVSATGTVDEIIEVQNNSFSFPTFSAGVYTDIDSITIPSGKWTVTVHTYHRTVGTPPGAPSDLITHLHTVAGNVIGTLTYGQNSGLSIYANGIFIACPTSFTLNVDLASSTTYFLKHTTGATPAVNTVRLDAYSITAKRRTD